MRKLIRLSLEIHNTLQIYIFFANVIPSSPFLFMSVPSLCINPCTPCQSAHVRSPFPMLQHTVNPSVNPRPHIFLPPSENAKTSLAMLQHCCSQYPATPPSPAPPMSSYRQETVIAIGVVMSILPPRGRYCCRGGLYVHPLARQGEFSPRGRTTPKP